jgi:hypothetical protein
VAAAGFALLPLALEQGGRGTGWISNWPLTGRLQAVGYYYLLGESGHPLGRLVEWAVLAPILVAVGLVWLADRRTLRPALLAASVGIAAILGPVLLAVFGLDYLAPRYLVAAWIPLSAALAVVVSAQRAEVAFVLAVAICCAFLAVDAAVVQRPQLQRGNWRWVADQLRGGPSRRAVVISSLGGLPLHYYVPSLRPPAAASGELLVQEIDLVGYEPLRPGTTRPPVRGFVRVARHARNGLVVVRFRAPRPLLVPITRLFAARPVYTPTEVMASAAG